MVAEISVLVEGYARELEGGGFRASPSSVLIEDCGMRILADPGADGERLLSALYREGLSLLDVDMIFITHPHLDHILNLRLFPQAEVLDPAFVYRGDESVPYGRFIPETEVEVLPTPGHTPDHGSLLVPGGTETWLVAGDLFWWRDGAVPKTDLESLLAQEDDLAWDPPSLRASRLAALERADVVIPGHGKVFRPAGRPR